MSKHDKLQSQCFLWIQRNHPELRTLCWCNDNSPASKRDGARRKASGRVVGVFDLLLYKNKTLFAFDVKVGNDNFSEAQLDWKEKIENEGGQCFEVRSLCEFQELIESLI